MPDRADNNLRGEGIASGSGSAWSSRQAPKSRSLSSAAPSPRKTVRSRSNAYAPCECGSWPLPSDARAGRCLVCHRYRPARWYRRAHGWRALALAALYPIRVLARGRS